MLRSLHSRRLEARKESYFLSFETQRSAAPHDEKAGLLRSARNDDSERGWTWMAGSGPAMTARELRRLSQHLLHQQQILKRAELEPDLRHPAYFHKACARMQRDGGGIGQRNARHHHMLACATRMID